MMRNNYLHLTTNDELIDILVTKGIIKKDDLGYSAQFKEDGSMWSRKTICRYLADQFGYSKKTNHVSAYLLHRFNKLCEEYLITYPKYRRGSGIYRPRIYSRLDHICDMCCVDRDVIPREDLNEISKRYGQILKIENEERKKRRTLKFIDWVRDKYSYAIIKDLNGEHSSHQGQTKTSRPEDIESIVQNLSGCSFQSSMIPVEVD